MTRTLLLTLSLMTAPLAALAMPVVGDVVGTDPTTAATALETAGCHVTNFEAEDGKVEALCTDTTDSKAWDVIIDPKSGAITEITASDD